MPWIDAASRDLLGNRRWLEVEVGGRALLLYDIEGAVYATAAICPHHFAFLSQGGVSGDCVDCPRHQGQFHIPTGEQRRGPPCGPLATYPARVEAGRVLVEI